MDTLSSSVSSLKVPISSGLHSTSREFSHLRAPNTSHLYPHLHVLTSTTKPNSISNVIPTSFTTAPFFSSSQTLGLKQSPIVHRKAASGYAAALIDVARCNNSLEIVERDVRKFARLLRNEEFKAIMSHPFVDDKEKGRVLKEVAEKGRFHRHLVVLLKMLVEKNKLGMVSEVLEEFQRIHDELSGTARVVLLSSGTKMEEHQLFGIARRVHKVTGAMKVKLRHLVSSPELAFTY